MSQEDSVTTSGWNDPPSFTYTTNIITTIPTSTPLKPILLPSPQLDTQPKLEEDAVTLYAASHQPESNSELSICELLRKCLSNSELKFKPSVFDSLSSKLELLETSLQTDSLPAPVLTVLSELANAISARDWSRSYQLHISLLADYPTHVNSWILAIKKIILVSQQ